MAQQPYWSNCSNQTAGGSCYLYTGSAHTTPVADGYYAAAGTYYTVSGGAGLITAVTACPLNPSSPFQLQGGSGGSTFKYTSSIDYLVKTETLAAFQNMYVCVKCGTTPRKTAGAGNYVVAPGQCSEYPTCP